MSFLHGRSGHELLVIGRLSAIWPYQTSDAIWSAAAGVDTMKRKHRDLWEALMATCEPQVVAECVVDVALSETRGVW